MYWQLNIATFIAVLVISFVPFYLGYFMMLFGTTRNLGWNDIFYFRISPKFHWNFQTMTGLVVHVIGRLAPYFYILMFGTDLPAWIYFIVSLGIISTLFLLVKKIIWNRRSTDLSGITIVRQDIVDAQSAPVLWKIYNDTFEKINKISPCRQSFDEVHFMEVLRDPSVRKYIILEKDNDAQRNTMIGLGLITNDFKNLPWISWEYFEEHFPEEFSKKLIFYFIGLAIDQARRGNSYSISLIEHIIDDIPEGGIMGFDHSHAINPMLHHFTRIVRQAKKIRRLHLDRQHYHLVRRK